MPLPVITNTTDDPTITTDDAANMPPSSVYPCTPFQVDVKGPGFASGDVTWSVLNSSNVAVTGALNVAEQNTAAMTITFPANTPAGVYTIKACLTSNMSDCSTQNITLLANPPITVGTPNQPVVGGHTQFSTTLPYTVTWSPSEVNSSTGLATWTSTGVKTVTYTHGSCTVTKSYQVYADVAVAEYDGTSPVYLASGNSIPLTVTGGSGTYTYSVTGQNTINNTGVLTAGLYAGEYRVTIVDANAGIIKNIPFAVGSQTQFCVAVEKTACEDIVTDPCCEISVDCGETVTLKVPTFHMRINGHEQPVLYSYNSGGSIGDAGYFRSGSGITDARANSISCDDSESLFEIVTSLDMADVANGDFGIGFTESKNGTGVASIDTAIAWFTSSGSRYVEVRQSGVAVSGTKFAIAQGDIVSAGYKEGVFVLYINNLLKSTVPNILCCGSQFLDLSIEQANKSLGGNFAGLTWTIVTAGSPSEVGTINETGIYSTPINAKFSLVQAEATVGNAKFRVNIRNIKPTPSYTRPKAFLSGKVATVWVGPYIPNMNENIRLAKDGSPDALQNTYNGVQMINLGVLEASANFQFTRTYQDFQNDLGVIYESSVTQETATLALGFLEVRDLDKLKTLISNVNLHAKKNGVRELSTGGGICGLNELRVIMVIGNPGCGDEFDVLYLPRVQNKGNLGLDIGKKTASKVDVTLTALPDYTRPTGKQLFSLYQIDSCSNGNCAV